METRNFRKMLEAKWAEGKFVCVGLDSELSKLPKPYCGYETTAALTLFNKSIVDATKDLVCAYKPNSAFYEAHGEAGWRALRETIEHINKVAPGVPVIYDAKRADIGNTNDGYVKAAFDVLLADAITVNPYFGQEALEPFLARKDKGIIVLCRTSNKGAGEFQNLVVDGNLPLYQRVAHMVATKWNYNGNCGLVVGATYPEELQQVRSIVGDMPILIPGVGAQGGDLEASVKAAQRCFIINSSRGIIFAKDPQKEAENLHRSINQYQSGGVS